jgi:hypothetical protein
VRDDRDATGRQLGDRRDVEVAEHRHRDRARDRRRREHEHVGRHGALATQRLPLFDAESVLLVDDHEPEVEELDRLAHQGVSADDDVGAEPDTAASIAFLRSATVSWPVMSVGRSCAARSGPSVRDNRSQVLAGEHLGRREQGRLSTRIGDREHRPQRDEGLTGSDLALHEPVHRRLGCQVGGNLLADRWPGHRSG